MIPRESSKRYVKGVKDMDMVAFLMEKYLSRWEMKSDKSKEFAEKYLNAIVDKALSGEVRIIFPHNLGYMQVLTHKYNGGITGHTKKFGLLDYSLVWVKHPMFCYHRIKTSSALNKRVRQKKLEGVNYFTEYVDGDTYAG